MQTPTRDLTLRGYLDTIKRHRVLILLCALVCAGAALAVSLTTKKSYSAQASLSVSDPAATAGLVGVAGFSQVTPLQLASQYQPQVTRDEVLQAAKKQLKSPQPVSALHGDISTAVDPNSYAINITATSPTPDGASSLANAVASADIKLTSAEVRAQYKSQADSLRKQLKGVNKTTPQYAQTAETLGRLQNLASVATPLANISQASPPSSPSSPKTPTDVAAALAFGLLLGIAIATGRDALDRRLRLPEDVTSLIEQPVVANIRRDALGHAGTVAGKDGRGPLPAIDGEAFRILRQNMTFLAASGERQRIVVTSAMAQEGKSTVAACLALSLAEAGKQALLVECDLRKPVLAERFGIKAAPGITDYLTGNAPPKEILQSVPGELGTGAKGNGTTDSGLGSANNLVCITAGTPVSHPAELLASDQFKTFLREVGSVYDIVVLDTPPLLPVADTLEMAPEASTLLLCVRLRQTTREQAKAAKEALSRLPGKPTGLVLTDVRENEGSYYGSYYGK